MGNNDVQWMCVKETLTVIYPPVSSNMAMDGQWTIEISDLIKKTSIQFGDFPASHVNSWDVNHDGLVLG